jgi:hypothetical protein
MIPVARHASELLETNPMKKPHQLLAAITGLGGFGLGYLTGQSAKTGNASDASSSPSATRQAGHGNQPSSIAEHSATKSKTRNASADSVPSPEKGLSRRVVAMMSAGELQVGGVDINGDSLMPGEKVKEFLDLTDEQFETMKQIGRQRLQAMQEHEQSITNNIVKVSEQEMVFDILADPAFAEREKDAFTEEIRKEFGPDVAAVLQSSIKEAYREFAFPRHVRYTLSPRPDPVPDSAKGEIRQMLEGLRDFKIGVNQNEDGTYMTDEQGMILPGSSGSSGTVSLHDPKPDAWRPRYHYLWQQANGQK